MASELDWRLSVRFETHGHAHAVFSALKTHTSSALAANRLGDGVHAEHDGQWLRVYGASLEALRRGQSVVADVIRQEGVEAEELAEHRSAAGAAWQRAELPPAPDDRDARDIHEHRGAGPWGAEAEPGRVQAHFELESRRAAEAFAAQLVAAGYDVHHSGSFVFIFADDAAAAHRIGAELKALAPAGAQLYFEGEGRALFI